MTNLDEDRLELLERQLADKITDRVRPALFKLYASVGLAVIGALGFVSWDLVDDIKSDIKADVISTIDEEIKQKRKEILEQVTESRIMAKRVNVVIQRLEEQLDDFQPQAENLDETINKVKALNVKSQNLMVSYSQEVKPLVSNVESLSNQLSELAVQVDQLNAIALNNDSNSNEEYTKNTQQRGVAIKSVISDLEESKQLYSKASSKVTVFIQFSGGLREQAETLSSYLKSKGYYVPGEERERAAAGKHEVRYFHPEDKTAAENLIDEINRELFRLDYLSKKSKVKTKSLVKYSGTKPKQGVLELWLEIKPN